MSTKKKIGRIPISKGKYVAGQTYNRLSQVTLYGSTYQSMIDGNTSAPAILDENGNVQHANTDQWLVIADGREVYNAGERTSCFSMEENPEYLAVETDAEGKILSYRDKDGTKYEHKMQINNLSLTDDGLTEFGKLLKEQGISGGCGDWSDYPNVHIPEPQCAYVNIEGNLPATKGKPTQGIIHFYDMQGNYFKKFIEMDIHGNTSKLYRKKNYTFDFYNDKECSDSFTIKFGDWVSMDSYYFQGWYSDAFRGIDIIEYKLYQQMVNSRGFMKNKPYKYYTLSNVVSKGNDTSTDVEKNLGKNALCTPMGFPVIMYVNGGFWGIYSVMLKKNRENFLMDKKDYSAVMLDPDNGNIMSGIKDWASFEIRNPKTLICMDGSKYNGDNPKELIDASSDKYDDNDKDIKNSAKTKAVIIGLADAYNQVKAAIASSKSSTEIKQLIEKYYNVDYIIDYLIFANIIQNDDGWGNNWQWTTWDGVKWNPNPYDLNSSLGLGPYGIMGDAPSGAIYRAGITSIVYDYYLEELKSRYKQLRDDNIISVDNIMSLFNAWVKRIGTDNYKEEFKKWNTTPSQRDSNLNSEYWKRASSSILPGTYPTYSKETTYPKGKIVQFGEKFYESLVDNNIGNELSDSEKWKPLYYDPNIDYKVGDEVFCTSVIIVKFQCIKACRGQNPITKYYDEAFGILGFHDSIGRIYKWFEENITLFDTAWQYKNV